VISYVTLVAGNILLLRGAIRISPPDRRSASYEYLSSLVGDYLVNTALDVDTASVLSILPTTQCTLPDSCQMIMVLTVLRVDGLDLNPLFTGISSFRPAGEGGQLKLFDLVGIKLVHGWLVDPDSQEFAALSKTEDYDTSLDAIVAGDAVSGRSNSDTSLSEADQELVLHCGYLFQRHNDNAYNKT
jgi:ubiquitin carboxyl-terminal hydrolase MINDY-1/2